VRNFDAIVIGTGQAGPPLAARLSAAGKTVAVIERGKFGGTCVNTGCIPTKTMVASAYAAHMAKRAADFGISTGPITVDMKRVKARKDEISGKSRTGVEASMKGLEHATVIQGEARFESPHIVSVNGEQLTAPHIFINVGGRAIVPPLPGLDRIPYLTNSSMMNVDFLPEHLIILGGSYIGLEFAQMFRRFGSQVTILESGPRLIAKEDEDISAAILEIIRNEGIEVRLNTKTVRFSHDDAKPIAHIESDGSQSEVKGSHLLVAIGRRPNTDDLTLDRAGVTTDSHGYIQVDDQLQTNVPGIWALGDCNGHGGFTHTSYNDFEIVAANLLDNDSRRLSDRIPAYALYIDPPLGRAGLTEAQVRQSGKPALLATRPMTKVGRAVEKGETQGFMKVIVDAESKLILGAAILGTGGDEVIHSLLDIMYAKAPYTVIQRAVHIHPTVSELIPTMLADLKPL
jgi:pyruvate/2-oxoglutarate dehydrogenase complex dihydrolipoamide dehydrogenase (E3) component